MPSIITSQNHKSLWISTIAPFLRDKFTSSSSSSCSSQECLTSTVYTDSMAGFVTRLKILLPNNDFIFAANNISFYHRDRKKKKRGIFFSQTKILPSYLKFTKAKELPKLPIYFFYLINCRSFLTMMIILPRHHNDIKDMISMSDKQRFRTSVIRGYTCESWRLRRTRIFS